jgi:hypothetical protein
VNGEDIVVMSPDEIRTAIDEEARASMGISGELFIDRWLHKTLPDSAAAWEIGMLVRLLDLDVDDTDHRNGTTSR